MNEVDTIALFVKVISIGALLGVFTGYLFTFFSD